MTLRDWHFLCIGGNAVALPLAVLLHFPLGVALSGASLVWSVLNIRSMK